MTTATAPAPITGATTTVTIPAEQRTKCEVWTRVMGYHRPINQFNIGKKQEALERTYFSVENSMGDEEECNDCVSCDGCGN